MATIEVRELIIKATVVQDGPANTSSPSSSNSNNNVSSNEEIIKVCVARVLEIIKEKDVR